MVQIEMENTPDIYATRATDDLGEPLCSNPEEDCADAIALHLAHEADPVKAIADFHLATVKAGQAAR